MVSLVLQSLCFFPFIANYWNYTILDPNTTPFFIEKIPRSIIRVRDACGPVSITSIATALSILFILISILFNSSNSLASESVSILLEEDNDTLMVIYRDSSGSDGMIISYGGYKWFKEV